MRKLSLFIFFLPIFISISCQEEKDFEIFYTYEFKSNSNPEYASIDTIIILKSDAMLKRFNKWDNYFYLSNLQHTSEKFYFFDNYDSSYLYYELDNTISKNYQNFNETKKILDFNCKKTEVISEQDTFIVFYTDELGCKWSPVRGVDGFVLEYEQKSKRYWAYMSAFKIDLNSTEKIIFDNNKYKQITQKKCYEKFEKQIENINNTYVEGQTAPNFSIKDLNGKAINLNEKNGRVLVLNFWFVGCRGCVHEIPELNKIVEYFKNNLDVEFYAFTFDSKSILNSFLQRKRFLFNIVPEASRISHLYGVKGYPTTIIIDKNGKIGKTYYSRLIGDYDVKTDYVIKDIEKLLKK